MDKAEKIWTETAAVEEIPDKGLHRKLDAPEDVREAAARLAGVRGIPALSAEFDLAKHGKGVRLTGRVRARVDQACVVTLEPIETAVDEKVDLLFEPGARLPADMTEAEALAGEESPEPLVDGKVDLGAVAIEFLMLGIDPYPRKPGAAFDAPKVEDEGGHPFAALASLKKPPGSGAS